MRLFKERKEKKTQKSLPTSNRFHHLTLFTCNDSFWVSPRSMVNEIPVRELPIKVQLSDQAIDQGTPRLRLRLLRPLPEILEVLGDVRMEVIVLVRRAEACPLLITAARRDVLPQLDHVAEFCCFVIC